jgi:hypothetical protein
MNEMTWAEATPLAVLFICICAGYIARRYFNYKEKWLRRDRDR